MLKIIKQCCDFEELYKNAWGQAIDVLKEIRKEGMEEELMGYLENWFPDGVDDVELNDLLAYDWQWVYSHIGMPLEAWDDVEEED